MALNVTLVDESFKELLIITRVEGLKHNYFTLSNFLST